MQKLGPSRSLWKDWLPRRRRRQRVRRRERKRRREREEEDEGERGRRSEVRWSCTVV